MCVCVCVCVYQCTLDDATDDWGIKVERVEIKDVKLPQQLQRAMAAEAEASREARAKVGSSSPPLTHSSVVCPFIHSLIHTSVRQMMLLSKATYSEFRCVIQEKGGVSGHLALGCIQLWLWTLGIEPSTFQLGVEHP